MVIEIDETKQRIMVGRIKGTDTTVLLSLNAAGEIEVSLEAVDIQKKKLHTLTTTPLGAFEEFISDSEEVLHYTQLIGTIITVGEPGTCFIKQSRDGIDWDNVYLTRIVIPDYGQTVGFSVELVSKYVRVYYENGPNPQTAFMLDAHLRAI